VTAVVGAWSRQTIWLAVDRRLSYVGLRPASNDATKLMALQAEDGVALLGYAGLGATSAATEPSAWMSNVLRGGHGTVEEALKELANAARRQLPPHLDRFPPSMRYHAIVAPAIVDGEPRIYTIDVALAPDRKKVKARYERHTRTAPNGWIMTPRFFLAGSGLTVLHRDLTMWARPLMSLLKAHDRELVSPDTVADRFWELISHAHSETTDDSVGPDAIVAWRYGPSAGGGRVSGHRFYTEAGRQASGPAIPSIANGMDVRALGDRGLGEIMRVLGSIEVDPSTGRPDLEAVFERIDFDDLNHRTEALPEAPDERLR
jgi:hypothetical protein